MSQTQYKRHKAIDTFNFNEDIARSSAGLIEEKVFYQLYRVLVDGVLPLDEVPLLVNLWLVWIGGGHLRQSRWLAVHSGLIRAKEVVIPMLEQHKPEGHKRELCAAINALRLPEHAECFFKDEDEDEFYELSCKHDETFKRMGRVHDYLWGSRGKCCFDSCCEKLNKMEESLRLPTDPTMLIQKRVDAIMPAYYWRKFRDTLMNFKAGSHLIADYQRVQVAHVKHQREERMLRSIAVYWYDMIYKPGGRGHSRLSATYSEQ